jgi:hypothetical protein
LPTGGVAFTNYIHVLWAILRAGIIYRMVDYELAAKT